jgi:hypothetical protein
MRLWSIHPKHLDSKGLVALWREALLAKAVLQGKTKGYKKHPQLQRFKEQIDPVAAINQFLLEIWEESCSRGMCFDKSKIGSKRQSKKINVSTGQVSLELNHLKKKLAKRSPNHKTLKLKTAETNPLFKKIQGQIEKWEKTKA